MVEMKVEVVEVETWDFLCSPARVLERAPDCLSTPCHMSRPRLCKVRKVTTSVCRKMLQGPPSDFEVVVFSVPQGTICSAAGRN